MSTFTGEPQSAPGGADTAARTTGNIGRRLDKDEELSILFGLGQDDEPVHPQHRGRAATTATYAPSPPFSLVFQPHESGATGPWWWMPMGGPPVRRRPTPNAKSPIRRGSRCDRPRDPTRSIVSAASAGTAKSTYAANNEHACTSADRNRPPIPIPGGPLMLILMRSVDPLGRVGTVPKRPVGGANGWRRDRTGSCSPS